MKFKRRLPLRSKPSRDAMNCDWRVIGAPECLKSSLRFELRPNCKPGLTLLPTAF